MLRKGKLPMNGKSSKVSKYGIRIRGKHAVGSLSLSLSHSQTLLRMQSLQSVCVVNFARIVLRKVFPLENEVDMRRHYTNALKQALFLQLGSSRAGMTLAKENQTRLWHAVKTSERASRSVVVNLDQKLDPVSRSGALWSWLVQLRAVLSSDGE